MAYRGCCCCNYTNMMRNRHLIWGDLNKCMRVKFLMFLKSLMARLADQILAKNILSKNKDIALALCFNSNHSHWTILVILAYKSREIQFGLSGGTCLVLQLYPSHLPRISVKIHPKSVPFAVCLFIHVSSGLVPTLHFPCLLANNDGIILSQLGLGSLGYHTLPC